MPHRITCDFDCWSGDGSTLSVTTHGGAQSNIDVGGRLLSTTTQALLTTIASGRFAS